MFQFAVIDDEQKDIELMVNAIDEHCTYHHIKYAVDTFSNPLDFDFHKHYDAIFLDIDMPQQNGITLARKINEQLLTRIIFMTQFSNYMHTTFNVHPFHFINKEHMKSESIHVLSLLFKELKSQVLTLKTKRGFQDIRIQDIAYISIVDGLTYICTDYGKYTTWESLSHLYEKLKVYGFEKANQSSLISLQYIKDINNNKITLKDNTVITLSTRMLTSFKKAYKLYLVENI